MYEKVKSQWIRRKGNKLYSRLILPQLKLSHPDHPNILIFITQSTREPKRFHQKVLLIKKKKGNIEAEDFLKF